MKFVKVGVWGRKCSGNPWPEHKVLQSRVNPRTDNAMAEITQYLSYHKRRHSGGKSEGKPKEHDSEQGGVMCLQVMALFFDYTHTYGDNTLLGVWQS